jgi:hypothetical protein
VRLLEAHGGALARGAWRRIGQADCSLAVSFAGVGHIASGNISFIGSLKAGFVTERSELGSCRAFRVQYPILKRLGIYRVLAHTGLGS